MSVDLNNNNMFNYQLNVDFEEPNKTKGVSCYVSNLTWWTTDNDLRKVIQQLGINDLLEIKFHENKVNGQSKGFAMVTVGSNHSYRMLMEKLPKKQINEQELFVTQFSKQLLSQIEEPSPPPHTSPTTKPLKAISPSASSPYHNVNSQQAKLFYNPNKLRMSTANRSLNNTLRPPAVASTSAAASLAGSLSTIVNQVNKVRTPLAQQQQQQPQPQPLVNSMGMNPLVNSNGVINNNRLLNNVFSSSSTLTSSSSSSFSAQYSSQRTILSNQQTSLLGNMPPLFASQPLLRLSSAVNHPQAQQLHVMNYGMSLLLNNTPRKSSLQHDQPSSILPAVRQDIWDNRLNVKNSPMLVVNTQSRSSLPSITNASSLPSSSSHPFSFSLAHSNGHNVSSGGSSSSSSSVSSSNSILSISKNQSLLPCGSFQSFQQSSQQSSLHQAIYNQSKNQSKFESEMLFHLKNMSKSQTTLSDSRAHEIEFQEALEKNRIISGSAISRAVQEATIGQYHSALETLQTAILLIKKSKIYQDERCKLLIGTLQDTKKGIEDRFHITSSVSGNTSTVNNSNTDLMMNSSRDRFKRSRSRDSRENSRKRINNAKSDPHRHHHHHHHHHHHTSSRY